MSFLNWIKTVELKINNDRFLKKHVAISFLYKTLQYEIKKSRYA
jgi:hypothetical protein